MKSTGYFPFERNHYFYGKLLTVRDFESEQVYFNNKRRLLNRLLHGCGVVAGLQVAAVDEKTITVEAGAALDYWGREIVVPAPVTMKLTMMEGFVNNEYSKNIYLCLAYDEKGKEPVHALGNQASAATVSEYNRIAEGYRLFIREDPPEMSTFHIRQLFEQFSLLYQDSNVRISLITPRYVQQNETFVCTIRLEKTMQTPKIRFGYEWMLENAVLAKRESERPFFEEKGTTQSSLIEIKTAMRAEKLGQINVGIKQGSGKLLIGDKQIAIEGGLVHPVTVVAGNKADYFWEDYFNRTLQQSLESNAGGYIHLAQIDLLQVGPSYVIEKVHQVPFGEYVYNPSVLARMPQSSILSTQPSQPFSVQSSAYWLGEKEQPRLTVDYDAEQQTLDFRLGIPRMKEKEPNLRCKAGYTDLVVNSENAYVKKMFTRSEITMVTDEIAHGLGPGHTYVQAGVDEIADHSLSPDKLPESDVTYYGDADVFRNSPFGDDRGGIKIGTICYPHRGTFRIGVRLPQELMNRKIRLRWWAFQDNSKSKREGESEWAEAAAATDEMKKSKTKK